ncbi:MAG: FAD-dependent oxidoreductase, partial [Candidatus Hydrogenedentes bacterium]|nr:FAD-dependent oxidoreductase [Candidatus Hydrogenedentota bacterium]
LRKKAYSVCVVDMLSAPGAGSTAFSCGIVRCHYSTYHGVALANESINCWSNWEDYLGTKDPRGIAAFHQCGVMFLLAPDWGVGSDQVAQLMEEVGVDMIRLSLEDLEQYYPYLDLAKKSPVRRANDPHFFDEDPGVRINGAIYENQGGFVPDAALAAQNMFYAAEQNGVEGRFGHRVAEVLIEGDHASGVRLESGEAVESRVVLNASGPHSAKVNAMLGMKFKLGLSAVRHEVHFLKCPQDIDLRAMPVFSDPDSGIYFRPDPPQGILLGSEDPPCDSDQVVDPDDFITDTTDELYRNQIMRLKKRIPSIEVDNSDSKNKRTAVGVGDIAYDKSGFGALYDVCTADWYPILDTTDVPGYYVAVGTSGGWFKGAPLIGLLVSELVDRVENGQDHETDPVTVKLPFSGNEIDMSFYSRNREPHSTSMGVVG